MMFILFPKPGRAEGTKGLPGFGVPSGEGGGMWYRGLCSAFSAQSFTVGPVFGSMSAPGLAESPLGQCLGQQGMK